MRVVGRYATGERATDGRKVSRRLFRLLGADRPAIVIIGLAGLVIAAVGATTPLLIGRTVDQYISRGRADGFWLPVSILLAAYAIGLVARVLQSQKTGEVVQTLLATLRSQIFASLQRQSARYYDKHQSGDLQSRLVNDVDLINGILSIGLTQIVASLVTAIGMVVGMILLDWRLALASFLVVPFILVTTRVFARRARQAFRRTRETIGDVSSDLQEDLSTVKMAQAFNRTDVNRSRFAERNLANRDANLRARAVTLAFSPAMDVFGSIAIASVIGYGGFLAINGYITIGVIVAFLAYVYQFLGPVQQIAQLFPQMQTALAAAERIFEIVDLPVDIADNPNPIPLPSVRGLIAFDDVDFAYDLGDPILQHVIFTVKPGQTVALVGPTGAGKSTIVNLVNRLYDVTSGRVLVDGIDVRDYSLADLRRNIGVVPQNTFFFSGTIQENIRYGRPDASDADVERAARLAHAHEFVMRLPAGYQTSVGERGARLSRGQRQLLAIARAILANPPILIFDEATSSVDSRTELSIQAALGELLRNRTSIIIAHRLSTIRGADLILVVEAGRVVERGTQVELLERNGLFASLYRRQFRDVEDRPPSQVQLSSN